MSVLISVLQTRKPYFKWWWNLYRGVSMVPRHLWELFPYRKWISLVMWVMCYFLIGWITEVGWGYFYLAHTFFSVLLALTKRPLGNIKKLNPAHILMLSFTQEFTITWIESPKKSLIFCPCSFHIWDIFFWSWTSMSIDKMQWHPSIVVTSSEVTTVWCHRRYKWWT